ncbi:DUF4405 domain-containing protein [Tenacibaculum sp. M341]|uniref:DUF4405 domain-containing protein n=1 Tax=Tenacibaculum sp. M341 TaxID=2530339 RepID=UPI0010508156|nr:DUF4405 domain-containing protein [Tenacibaculum sp. M341]TCI90197.1 hypothetical protein EYW44_14790 [Tenacibaculum sp. M341]
MRTRKLASISIAIIFTVISITGVLMYLKPHYKITASIHTLFGFLFVLLAFVHIRNNIKSLKMYSINKNQNFLSMPLITVLAIGGILLTGLLFNVSEFHKLYEIGNEHRNSIQGKETLADGTERIIVRDKINEVAVEVDVKIGDVFRNAMMVIWVEDMEGNYMESLFVPKSIASSEYYNGKPDKNGIWRPAIVRRPESLPYWAHKRGIKASDGLFIPLGKAYDIDAVSGATPSDDFIINSKAKLGDVKQFRILMEVNQSFNWNAYYSKDRFPKDSVYSGSGRVGQPAIVYAVTVDLDKIRASKNYLFEVIGHSHHSGKTGELFSDLSNITTALDIIERGIVKITK